MWTKVKKGNGRSRLLSASLFQNDTETRLYLPDLPDGCKTCNVYTDGAGKIAFEMMTKGGTYKIRRAGGSTPHVTVPAKLMKGIRLPESSVTVKLTTADGMIVLDTAALPAPRPRKEKKAEGAPTFTFPVTGIDL